MSERWLAKNTCSPRMKKFSSPMLSEHISGESSTVLSRSSTLSRGLPPVVSWTSRRSRAQPLVQLAGRSPVHRVRPVGLRACTCSTAAPASAAAIPCATISSGCSGRFGLASLPWMPPVRAQVMTTGSVLGNRLIRRPG
jgi:hypothetical protein